MPAHEARARFRSLHESGTFLMPNPFDRGSAKLLGLLGFPALATTSGGLATSNGRLDMTGDRRELVDHVAALCAATDLPVNVDAERCFPDEPGGIGATVELLAEAGAAGCSIEDWDPSEGRIDSVDLAAERVAVAATVADEAGLVLTARAENHLRGCHDLDDTIARLTAYRRAGAHVVYAPGLTDVASITRIVGEVGGPVNVLLLPGGPSRDDLAAIGVRRLSVGSSLARAAYGALYDQALGLLGTGALDPDAGYLDRDVAAAAFGDP